MNVQFVRVAIVLLLASLALSGSLVAAIRAWRKLPLGRMSRLSLALSALGIGCFLWGLFIEADWLEVTRVTVPTAKWPKGKKFRIAHFSDLHLDRESRALDRLGIEVAAAKADLLVFTGDSLNDAGSLKLLRTTLGSMTATLGRVAVRGNHDVYRWRALDLFGGGVATELTRGPIILDEGKLVLCGAAFNAFDALPDCIAGAPKGAFVVLAFHTPDLVEELAPKPDLYLAGHTHGGQIALPLYGALLTMSRYDKKYESGVRQVGPTTLVVNRGIGFAPHFPRVRFAARPELTIIDVEGTGPVE